MNDRLLSELDDWLRIPSVSTGEGDPRDLELAAQWVIDRVRAAGGSGDLVAVAAGNPLAVGELRAADPAAPTVLIYGHYDVQGPGDPQDWISPPFEPEIRDGRLFARGAADDKGNFLPLLHVACELAAAGTLPVNVRVLVEGEEEVGGDSVAEWVRSDPRGADAAIVFDSGVPDLDTPALTVGYGASCRCTWRRAPRNATCTPACTAAVCSTRSTSSSPSWPACSRAPTDGCATSCAPESRRPRPRSSPPGSS